MTRVLVLGGGPDAEREVSIASATAIHQGCLDAGLDATLLIVDRPDLQEVRAWDTDVIFPALHGRFGEGGGLQALLEQSRHPFVGSKCQAARLAMDKLATKLLAARFAIPTPSAAVFDATDAAFPNESVCPLEFPVVIKPVADGSSVGLHIVKDASAWQHAIVQVGADLRAHPTRVYMIERMVHGREMTVSVMTTQEGDLEALPIIEIAPAQGVYDYNAKYARNDTIYTPNPDIPEHISKGIKEHAAFICVALGVEHLARVDFLLGDDGHWTLLEVNTMPGFTKTSLFPKAAGAMGLTMPKLCAHLVSCALQTHTIASSSPTPS